MRRVIVSSDGVSVVPAEAPEPGPGEVLVRTAVAGVCGSDTHALAGLHPFIQLPYAPGHEVCGTVEATGSSVTAVTVGQRVTLEPFLPCWECKQCLAGRQNVCERLRFFGCAHDQGGMADYFTVDERRLHVIPDALTWEQAAFIEPLGTPVHAVGLAGGVREKAVAILGAGTIGILTLQVARAYGARRIVMTARSQASRDRALSFGADAVVDASSPSCAEDVRAALGESADVVFDCVAEQSTTDQALAMVMKAGTVIVVGVPPADVRIPLPLIQDAQLRIQGSATYLPADFTESMRLLVEGGVDVSRMVTAKHPLDQAAAAFADAASGRHLKVLLI
ncbi:alcohol dehydrogenase catalytic domain-containing protein [Actinoplanes sp. LDG1-06]|uniref:Alcohol dehydrogenase catalytic domain-containing protein n=1 Tax=Paractinoplanes ovalisporus TaxID=2810368 RepID=A0ABS2ATT2_9ACTN|nr:alcohol dehydrogenase catalytic domain-containing protein [Actinoplanes ovalisporus]MBM2623125.1 alcohol dehydrogenase catalytic domain-containing protein [Actinoplanes ovalisporus]